MTRPQPLQAWRLRRSQRASARYHTMSNEELTRAHWIDRRTFRWIGFGLALILAAGLLNGFIAQGQQDKQVAQTEALKKQQDQQKGFLVAVCAIPNVNRIFFVNAFKRLDGVGLHADASPADVHQSFLDTYKDLQAIDCKAFLSDKEKLQVCLQYPDVLPTPGEATTTSTTENQPACKK